MRVSVADVKKEPGSHKRLPVQISLESFEMAGQPVQFEAPFAGQAEIWNAGESLLVKARLTGEAQVQCSRCLTSFQLPLKVSFEEEFVQGLPDNSLDEDDEELLTDRTVTYYEGDEIDLADSLRENVLLELPMKPLCDQACKGLCPICGGDRNRSACDCKESSTVDNRMAVLKELLGKPDSN